MNDIISLCHTYLDAKRSVIAAGFDWEIDWQAGCSIDDVTEQYFLKEYAWVVLNTGFRERTVRQLFPLIEAAFDELKSAKWVWKNRRNCRRKALSVFQNKRKIGAILETCRMIAETEFEKIHEDIKREGVAALIKFPFMGPITSLHLAKNLGLNVVKPDRHLLRVAAAAGYKSPNEMCELLGKIVGDTVAEIDVVFWRFATLNPTWFQSLEATTITRSRESLLFTLSRAAAGVERL